ELGRAAATDRPKFVLGVGVYPHTPHTRALRARGGANLFEAGRSKRHPTVAGAASLVRRTVAIRSKRAPVSSARSAVCKPESGSRSRHGSGNVVVGVANVRARAVRVKCVEPASCAGERFRRTRLRGCRVPIPDGRKTLEPQLIRVVALPKCGWRSAV